jgi:hypothetical protein
VEGRWQRGLIVNGGVRHRQTKLLAALKAKYLRGNVNMNVAITESAASWQSKALSFGRYEL